MTHPTANFINFQLSTSFFQFPGEADIPSPVATGGLWWAYPPKQSFKPPNWNMKHYILVEFLSNLYVKPPPART